MSLADLEGVLDWAAAEGWNPGWDDAAAFLAADPDGFFVNVVDGAPVAAVSVVNHAPGHAFLGLYICRPDLRGRGYGMGVWQAGLAHAGTRCIGLDGVPAQQANYARSGFVRVGRTVRYQGRLDGTQSDGARSPDDPRAVIAADRIATGIDRAAFAQAWFQDTEMRRTISLSARDPARAFATVRACRDGVKIGPFHTGTPTDARALLAAATRCFGGETVFVDVPDGSPDMADLLRALGFAPVFETARMYSGAPPVGAPPPFYAGATLELG